MFFWALIVCVVGSDVRTELDSLMSSKNDTRLLTHSHTHNTHTHTHTWTYNIYMARSICVSARTHILRISRSLLLLISCLQFTRFGGAGSQLRQGAIAEYARCSTSNSAFASLQSGADELKAESENGLCQVRNLCMIACVPVFAFASLKSGADELKADAENGVCTHMTRFSNNNHDVEKKNKKNAEAESSLFQVNTHPIHTTCVS